MTDHSETPSPSDQALGAALIALESFPWRWWQWRMRRPTWLRSELAHAVASRVEPAALRAAHENPPPLQPSGQPPYSGDRAECIKCGYGPGSVARSRHEREATGSYRGGFVEFLTRTCVRCGYAWREQCADATSAPVANPAANARED